MKLIGRGHDFSSQDLDLLQGQLDFWRTQHGRWTRLPQGAWEAAATLARRFGPSYVSRRLRLGYAKLRRLSVPAQEFPAANPQFVEVTLNGWPAPHSQPGYRAELEGSKLTLQLGSDLPAVLALAEAFWRRPV